jgi:hypothetical protein
MNEVITPCIHWVFIIWNIARNMPVIGKWQDVADAWRNYCVILSNYR